MSGTPERLQEDLRADFRATNRRSYLANWSGKALSFHLGMADESTPSLDEAHLNTNRYLADRLDIREGTQVLDAGCGVGGTSIWLAHERGARVTGVTIDPEQAELASRFAAERGVADRVRFEVMDYAATTFEEATFDVVVNLESLCHAHDPARYVRHVRGLLRPGGRFGCLDYFRGSGDDRLVEQMCAGWVLPSLQTLPALAEGLRSAGFEAVEWHDVSSSVQRTAQQLKAMADNSLVMLTLAPSKQGEDDRLFEKHVRGAIAAGEGLASGAILYGYVAGRVGA